MSWIKENLHLDTPTEFVEGCETDNEEFFLMRLCKHNITIPSTFSKRAAWLNSNPDKKIFTDVRSDAKGVQQFHDSLTPSKKDALLDTKGLIGVPYDYYNQPEIPLQPIFSLLLVVNNDAANLPATLDSFLNQDYKYYEVIIIDNATTDGSDKICRQAIEGKINVTYKRLRKKIGNAAAWNRALKSAQGKYILFLKVGDRFFRTEPKKNLPFLKYGKHFLNDSLSWLYFANEMVQADIVHLCSWLEENTGGEVAFAGKKFSAQRDDEFQQTKQMSKDGSDAAQLLLNRQINSFLGTKLYYREFLKEHGIKFDEQLDDRTAELAFQAEAFLKTKYLMYLANALYVAPLQKSKQYSTARIDIQLVPKGEGDFQIVSVSDDKADVLKPGWFQKGGIGYMLQSYAGKLDIATKSTVDGRILLRLRGLDVRTPEDKSKRIPYWVDYTKLTVNGKVIFDKLTPAWHDKPYRYDLDVKAGEEIKIHAEWLLHYMGN